MDELDRTWPAWPKRQHRGASDLSVLSYMEPTAAQKEAFVEAVRAARDPRQYTLGFSDLGIPQ